MLILTLLKFILKSQVKTYSSIMKYLYHTQKFYRCHPTGTVMDKQKFHPEFGAMSQPKHITVHWEKIGTTQVLNQLYSLFISCAFSCCLLGILQLLWVPLVTSDVLSDLFSRPSPPSERDQLCNKDHGHYSAFSPGRLLVFLRSPPSLSLQLLHQHSNQSPYLQSYLPSNLFSVLQAECHSEMQV